MGSEVKDSWERRLGGKGRRRTGEVTVSDDRREKCGRASEKTAVG